MASESAGKRLARVPVKRLAIGLVAAFALGVAVTLQVRNWHALGVESGGSCGSGEGVSYGNCPRGSTLMLTLSFLSLIVTVPVAFVALVSGLKARLGLPVLAVAALLGVVPGQLLFGWLHGDVLETAWAAARERPSGVQGEGSWLHGSTVIRARFDRLSAYDLATGDVRWVYHVPAPQVLCAMSRGADGGVGLVGYGKENDMCSQVAAVNLSNGRALWTKDLAAAATEEYLRGLPPQTREQYRRPGGLTVPLSLPRGTTPDMVAVAGDVAVVQTDRLLQGFGLREGEKSWERQADERCRFDDVAGGAGQFLVEVTCAEAAPKLWAVDPADGKTRWEVPVPIRSTSANVTLLSASPAVAHVREGGQRGIDVVVSLDQSGRILATVEIDDGHRRLNTSDAGFDAAPVRGLMVQGDLLVASAQKDRGRNDLQAYGLGDGRLRWSTRVEDIEAVQAERDRVLVLVDGPRAPDLLSLSLRDGRATHLGVTRFRWLTSDVALYSQGGRYVVVSEDATSVDAFPVAVLRVK
ncbi:PQQ-like domain-containing protein [Thermomonospora echinospora]|uniref:PQQ-like domain-containing protein n=1 Tax=Thermomonospora echinospora TaxID=1992 RepID=A0A1H6B6L9_9ACTN|nr:PQQ-binding-like beta-propeller repeat protein [Thermomonospora echinospora]SEG56055.1 PQQ-like domain-containing protein [Thermomonospora echinospora]